MAKKRASYRNLRCKKPHGNEYIIRGEKTMKNRILRSSLIFVLCFCLIGGSAVLAGEGLYPSITPPSNLIELPNDVVPPVVTDGQIYFWSEELGEYIPGEHAMEPTNDKFGDTGNLQPAPSKEGSIEGIVKCDTLIYSGPSTPAQIFEDNGEISGGTKLFIYHEESGYYFVESKENGVRGYLPINVVSIDVSLKTIKRQNVMKVAAAINELGITKKNGNSFVVYDTYSQMNDSPAYKIGSIGSTAAREIVQVISSDIASGVTWYYIQYKTSSGYKNAYIKANNIYRPNYGYSKPIASGKFTSDYDVNLHKGVDIAGNDISVNAVANGILQYVVRYKMAPNDILTFVSYGRHAKLTTSDATFIYAHMGSYSNPAFVTVKGYDGITDVTYSLKTSNSMLSTASESWDASRHKEAIAYFDSVNPTTSKPVSPGDIIGTSGWTGYVLPSGSSGAHLHFEVSSAASGNKDPFNYVLFPGICYLGSTV